MRPCPSRPSDPETADGRHCILCADDLESIISDISEAIAPEYWQLEAFEKSKLQDYNAQDITDTELS